MHTRFLLLILVVAHVCVLIRLYGIRGVCARRLALWRRGRGRVWGCANMGVERHLPPHCSTLEPNEHVSENVAFIGTLVPAIE